MTAAEKTREVLRRLNGRGINVTFEQAETLRRAELALHREETGVPHMYRYPYNSTNIHRTRIADKEAGALRRVTALCKEVGVYFFHQTDPRGCALYVSHEVITANDYSTCGVNCCA